MTKLHEVINKLADNEKANTLQGAFEPLEVDTNGDPIITVGQLVTYLAANFKPDARVHLDKNGWENDLLHAGTPMELIERRGVFTSFDGDLFINN